MSRKARRKERRRLCRLCGKVASRSLDTVKRAVDVLNRYVDRDPDFEDDGSAEPSLGAPNPTFPSLDIMPAPWAINRGLTQDRWSGYDIESEHDGREPEDI